MTPLGLLNLPAGASGFPRLIRFARYKYQQRIIGSIFQNAVSVFNYPWRQRANPLLPDQIPPGSSISIQAGDEYGTALPHFRCDNGSAAGSG